MPAVGREIAIERVRHVLCVTALDQRTGNHRAADRLALPFRLTHERRAVEHYAEAVESIEHVLDLRRFDGALRDEEVGQLRMRLVDE
jgi:hypothetical protein